MWVSLWKCNKTNHDYIDSFFSNTVYQKWTKFNSSYKKFICNFFENVHTFLSTEAFLSTCHSYTISRSSSPQKELKLMTELSWIKIDQLMSLALFFAAQHVSNASTFIFRSLWLCVGILLWFNVCWHYGVVQLGWWGILMQVVALVPHWTRAVYPHTVTSSWRWMY